MMYHRHTVQDEWWRVYLFWHPHLLHERVDYYALFWVDHDEMSGAAYQSPTCTLILCALTLHQAHIALLIEHSQVLFWMLYNIWISTYASCHHSSYCQYHFDWSICRLPLHSLLTRHKWLKHYHMPPQYRITSSHLIHMKDYILRSQVCGGWLFIDSQSLSQLYDVIAYQPDVCFGTSHTANVSFLQVAHIAIQAGWSFVVIRWLLYYKYINIDLASPLQYKCVYGFERYLHPFNYNIDKTISPCTVNWPLLICATPIISFDDGNSYFGSSFEHRVYAVHKLHR